VGFREAGLTVGRLEIYKFWGGGVCRVKEQYFTEVQLRGWLIGMAAGCEGQLRWGELRGIPQTDANSSYDFSMFHTYAPEIGLSESEARHEAAAMLVVHWDEVEEHAPELARKGRYQGRDVA
jgi:hypothetical protein